MSAALRLFDLAGADDRLGFSPNCWRTRLALAQRGLGVETIAWRMNSPATKDSAFGSQGRVCLAAH